MSEYFVQLGIIVFPICVYIIWTFDRSFTQFPHKTWFFALYGGITAILCQRMPVQLLGQTEYFQCVPIILSILYGKRRAGLFAILILGGYQLYAHEHLSSIVWSLSGIVVYSILPMVYCHRFDRFPAGKRFVVSQILSVATIVIQLSFVLVYCFVLFGKNSLSELYRNLPFLSIACVIQLGLMAVSFFLLEHIILNGRIRERQAAIVKYNPIGICVFDENKRFVTVNPAYEQLTGYREAELAGRDRAILWFDEYVGSTDMWPEPNLGSIRENLEVVIKHKLGHGVHIRYTMLPMMEDAHLVGYLAMVTDISETKAAEEYVRNSEKLTAVGQLAAGIAHEIRNPLTAIKGFIQLLSTGAHAAPDRYYEIMRSEISRIEGIVNEMLVLAKPQAVNFRPVCIRKTLEDVAYLLESEANMQNVQVAHSFEHCESHVMADPNQLKQVFLNVGKNAIEAMPAGGRLELTMVRQEVGLTIRFIDNGQGIAPDVLQKLGEPFFTTKEKGTGLGLLTSKRIIADHGGSIEFQSTPGAGTTVLIRLPQQHRESSFATKWPSMV